MRGRLAALGIDATVTGRPKHLWSIYEKMVVRGKEFDEIYDLVGIRIVVESEKDCWAALGSVHALWPPVPGPLQGLHQLAEVQPLPVAAHDRRRAAGKAARDPDPHPGDAPPRRVRHRRALGLQGGRPRTRAARAATEDMEWLQRIVDWERDTPDPIEFLETLKLDLDQGEVYVFTPKGAIITLPTGATPVDFAYAIHTEVGHRCIGARVNGRLVPLDSKLTSGDTVEIFTSKIATAGPVAGLAEVRRLAAGPEQDPPVVLPRAARGRDRERAGRARQGAAPRGPARAAARRLDRPRRARAAARATPTSKRCYAAIGEGHCSARGRRAAPAARARRRGEEQLPTTVLQTRRPSAARSGSVGVYVEGLDDVMVRLSRCCTPVPGDAIIGFVTRGRGVSVHREDCANALALVGEDQERLIEVEWDEARSGVFVAGIEVKALDRAQLLADVARVLAEHHVPIISSSSQMTADRVARMRFECELADSSTSTRSSARCVSSRASTTPTASFPAGGRARDVPIRR